MDVSIIIVSYNVCRLVCKCIQSVYEKVKDTSFEVIVVDNASSDDTVKQIKDNYPEVKLIASPTNLGFGRANNLGASKAEGNYLFFLNPDTEMVNDAVTELHRFMDSHPQVALGGGNLFTPEMSPNNSYSKYLYKLMDGLASSLFYKLVIPHNRDRFNHTSSPKPVSWVSGANMFIRRSVFDEIGRFDDRYFMYFEEQVFAHKIMKLGMATYNVPSARIIHHEGASSKKSHISLVYFDSFLKYYHDFHPLGYRMIYMVNKLKIGFALFIFRLRKNREKEAYWSRKNAILNSNK